MGAGVLPRQEQQAHLGNRMSWGGNTFGPTGHPELQPLPLHSLLRHRATLPPPSYMGDPAWWAPGFAGVGSQLYLEEGEGKRGEVEGWGGDQDGERTHQAWPLSDLAVAELPQRGHGDRAGKRTGPVQVRAVGRAGSRFSRDHRVFRGCGQPWKWRALPAVLAEKRWGWEVVLLLLVAALSICHLLIHQPDMGRLSSASLGLGPRASVGV